MHRGRLVGRARMEVTSGRVPLTADRALCDQIVAFSARHTASSSPQEVARVTAAAVLASCPNLSHVEITVHSDDGARRVDVRRADLDIATEPDKPFGHVDVVDENERSGLYVLHIGPGAAIDWHRHDVMRERELILTDGLVAGTFRNGRRREWAPSRGTVLAFPRGVPHRYHNDTASWQRVLCMDAPPFIPADEIVVDVAPRSDPAEDG